MFENLNNYYVNALQLFISTVCSWLSWFVSFTVKQPGQLFSVTSVIVRE